METGELSWENISRLRPETRHSAFWKSLMTERSEILCAVGLPSSAVVIGASLLACWNIVMVAS